MDKKLVKVLIIDDEAPARTILRKYLELIDGVEVLKECQNGFEGLKAIQELEPDLIMLDIQMPKLTGLEMLELLEQPPKVIFVTAYDQYAVKAFDANAVDYLLKPYSPERLEKAISKVMVQETAVPLKEKITAVQTQVMSKHSLDRILVRTGNKIHIIDVNDIQYIQAQDDYVMIHTENEKHLKQQTMRYLEENLDEQIFFRAHRSYIVNITAIISIDLFEKDSYILKMSSGVTIPVSKSGYARLKRKF